MKKLLLLLGTKKVLTIALTAVLTIAIATASATGVLKSWTGHDELEKAELSVQNLVSTINTIEGDIVDKTNQLNSLQSQLNEAQAQLDADKATIENLESEIESLTILKLQYEQELNIDDTEIADLNSQIATLKAEKNTLYNAINDPDTGYIATISDLNSQVTNLTNDLSSMTDSRDSYKRQLQAANDEINILRANLDEANDDAALLLTNTCASLDTLPFAYRVEYQDLCITENFTNGTIVINNSEFNSALADVNVSKIYVANGHYELSNVNITRPITIVGESENGVIIDGSNSTSYGFHIQTGADDSSISNLTYYGPASKNYGFKVADITNFTMDSVSIYSDTENEGRTGLDFNGVDGITLNNVSSFGAGYGNGISFTDSNNIQVSNITTDDNAWGGIGLYAFGKWYDGGVDTVTMVNTINANEDLPVYIQWGDGYTVTGTNLIEYPYTLTYGNGIYYYNDLVSAGRHKEALITLEGALTEDISIVDSNGDAAIISNIINDTTSNTYTSLETAIAEASSGDTLTLDTGVYGIDAVELTKDINISGATDSNVVIVPRDLTSSSETDAMFVVSDGVSASFNNVTFDGEGRVVGSAIYAYGTVNVDNVTFKDIKQSASYGFGVIMKGEGSVTNSNFTGIQRVGVHMGGYTVNKRQVLNNTYIGSNTEDNKLDYAFELGRGAQAIIEGNTIIGNIATYDSADGSTTWGSAGILISSYYQDDNYPDARPYAEIRNNVIKDCSVGVYIGYNANDISHVVIGSNNVFSNNDYNIYATVDDTDGMIADGITVIYE